MGGAERFAIASEARSDEPLSRSATTGREPSPARNVGLQGRAEIVQSSGGAARQLLIRRPGTILSPWPSPPALARYK